MRNVQSSTIGHIAHVSECSVGIITALGERIIVDIALVDDVAMYQRVVVKSLNDVVYSVVNVGAWYSSYNTAITEVAQAETQVVEVKE